jgi:hypothetical protein
LLACSSLASNGEKSSVPDTRDDERLFKKDRDGSKTPGPADLSDGSFLYGCDGSGAGGYTDFEVSARLKKMQK